MYFIRVEEIRPYVDRWKQELRFMGSVFEELGVTQAFCHHDIHGRNIIYNEKTGDTSIKKFAFEICLIVYLSNVYSIMQ